MIEEVTVTRHTCDGCGKIQDGEITDNVFGVMGKAVEHDQGGGGWGGEWFACSRPCIQKAVITVLDRDLDSVIPL